MEYDISDSPDVINPFLNTSTHHLTTWWNVRKQSLLYWDFYTSV